MGAESAAEELEPEDLDYLDTLESLPSEANDTSDNKDADAAVAGGKRLTKGSHEGGYHTVHL